MEAVARSILAIPGYAPRPKISENAYGVVQNIGFYSQKGIQIEARNRGNQYRIDAKIATKLHRILIGFGRHLGHVLEPFSFEFRV